MKFERPSFIVVTASKLYREGWDRIFKPESPAKPVGSEPIARKEEK